jgi:hypothetical protein
VGSWCSLPGAIPQDEIIAVFKEKSKRSKGKQAEQVSGVAEPGVIDVDMTDS